MRHVRFALLLPLLWTSTLVADAHGPAAAGPTPDQAYLQVLEGHARYLTNARTLPRQNEARRCETTTGGQHPVAAVLSCADSRVPPELLFDQGLGDLFVIRVAGNVAAADELGTLEYGIEHLKISLIVVLGHTKCGAVTAVVEGAHAEGNLAELLQPIGPAAARARQLYPTYKGPQLVSSAIGENVRQQINNLSARSPVLAKAIAGGRVKVVGGVYDIHSGQVDWLQSISLAAAQPSAHAHIAPPAKMTPSHAEPTRGEAAHDPHAAAHADHDEPDAHAPHAPTPAAKPVAAKTSHAIVDLSDNSHGAVITPKTKPSKSAAKHAAPAHDDADDAHRGHATADDHAPASHAAAHDDADDHEAKPLAGKGVKADQAEAGKATASLVDQWPILAGVAVASTLIGAAVTRFAPKP